jgi:Spy/CpxP family protein refolding chaperone
MKNALLLLAALALTSAAQAQTTPAAPAQTAPLNSRGGAMRSPEQQAEAQAQRLAKELNLTADQQTKVQQLMATQRQETQTAIQNAGGNRRAMGQAMRAGRDKFTGQLQTVLTPDQYTKYQQIMTERRAKMQERRQGGGGMGDDLN